jgi:hypothetical protein
MARGEHSPACARRWRQQAEARQWTMWQTVQAIHGCCGASLLKAHRLARGWSARQAIQELEYLCDDNGLGSPRASIDLLNAWENGRARPRPQTIDLLARLYKANAVRLGLAADYCEDVEAQKVVVVAAGGQDGPTGHPVVEEADDDAERRALFHDMLLSTALPGGRFFAEVERTRQDIDLALAAGNATEDQLDRLDEQVLRFRREYMDTASVTMLCRLMLELSGVRRLLALRQPAAVQRRLLHATTMLALLAADALMRLGDTRQAAAWYGTARTASDDIGDLRLRALVRAQETMLSYYYGDLTDTVRLAREARMLAGNAPSSPAALAAAAEARALARLGDRKAAKAALAEAEQIFARMRGSNQDDLAFAFSERRLHFYRTGTLIELGAFQVEESALRSGEGFHSLDLCLVLLEQAEHLARDGDMEGACGLAVEALMQVPVEQRTSIVVNRAHALLTSVPPELREADAVRHLHELLMDTLPQTPLAHALAAQTESLAMQFAQRSHEPAQSPAHVGAARVDAQADTASGTRPSRAGSAVRPGRRDDLARDLGHDLSHDLRRDVHEELRHELRQDPRREPRREPRPRGDRPHDPPRDLRDDLAGELVTDLADELPDGVAEPAQPGRPTMDFA